MTLAPPLWADGSWAVDAWADGSWSTEVAAPAVFGDLSTLFVGYLDTLRDTDTALDADTEVALHLPTVRATSQNLDDANTMYAEYLS